MQNQKLYKSCLNFSYFRRRIFLEATKTGLSEKHRFRLVSKSKEKKVGSQRLTWDENHSEYLFLAATFLGPCDMAHHWWGAWEEDFGGSTRPNGRPILAQCASIYMEAHQMGLCVWCKTRPSRLQYLEISLVHRAFKSFRNWKDTQAQKGHIIYCGYNLHSPPPPFSPFVPAFTYITDWMYGDSCH